MMTNSIGIIDRAYQGNIFISLTKIEDDAVDLESSLPFRCCQLVFRRQHFVPLEVGQFDVVTSVRGQGGYGSTGGGGGVQ
jgi:dUTPase